MPGVTSPLFSLRATGKLGGHRRGRKSTLEILEGPPPMLPHIVGHYYTAPTLTAALGTATQGPNILNLHPFVAPELATYDRIAAEQTGAGATNYRLGVYGPITQALEGAPLVLDSGIITVAAAAVVEATISLALNPGWYILATVSDQSRAVRTLLAAAILAELGKLTVSATAPLTRCFVAHAFGPLPSSIPAGLSYDTNPASAIFLRKS